MPYLLTELLEDVTSVTTRSASTHDPSCRVCDFLRISRLVYLPTSTSASMTRPCSIFSPPNVSNTSALSLPHLKSLVLATSSLKSPTQQPIVLTANRFHKHRYTLVGYSRPPLPPGTRTVASLELQAVVLALNHNKTSTSKSFLPPFLRLVSQAEAPASRLLHRHTRFFTNTVGSQCPRALLLLVQINT